MNVTTKLHASVTKTCGLTVSEFTQVDIETSFMERDDLLNMMERLMVKLFKETIGVELATPFQRISYADAMGKYGSDKPDLRFGMELIEMNDIVANSGVKVFSSVIEKAAK